MLARRAALAIATSACVIAAIGGAATACSQAYAAADAPAGDAAGNATGDAASGTDALVDPESAVAIDGASDALAGPDIHVLASGYSTISAIAADDTDVYFADQATGGIHRVPITGGSVVDLVTAAGAPSSMALAGGSIYWTDTSGQAVVRYPTNSGGQMAKSALAGMTPRALATTSDHVFVIFTGMGGGDGEVVPYGLDLTADPTGPVAGLTNPFSIAAQDTRFSWTEGAPANAVASGDVGSTNRKLVAQAPDAESIATDRTHLFWTDSAAGMVLENAAAGGSVIVATAQQAPRSLASDGTFVYWLTQDGFLRRTDVDGTGMPTTVASGFAAPLTINFRAVALTSTYVVWFTEDGRVLRIAK